MQFLSHQSITLSILTERQTSLSFSTIAHFTCSHICLKLSPSPSTLFPSRHLAYPSLYNLPSASQILILLAPTTTSHLLIHGPTNLTLHRYLMMIWLASSHSSHYIYIYIGWGEPGINVRGSALMLFLFYENVSRMHLQSRWFSQSLMIPAPWVLQISKLEIQIGWSIPLVPSWVTTSDFFAGNWEA